jgi:hypothetical protein
MLETTQNFLMWRELIKSDLLLHKCAPGDKLKKSEPTPTGAGEEELQ